MSRTSSMMLGIRLHEKDNKQMMGKAHVDGFPISLYTHD